MVEFHIRDPLPPRAAAAGRSGGREGARRRSVGHHGRPSALLRAGSITRDPRDMADTRRTAGAAVTADPELRSRPVCHMPPAAADGQTAVGRGVAGGRPAMTSAATARAETHPTRGYGCHGAPVARVIAGSAVTVRLGR